MKDKSSLDAKLLKTVYSNMSDQTANIISECVNENDSLKLELQKERSRAEVLVKALEKIKDRKPENPLSIENAYDGNNLDDCFRAGLDSESSQVAWIAEEALSAYKSSEESGGK